MTGSAPKKSSRQIQNILAASLRKFFTKKSRITDSQIMARLKKAEIGAAAPQRSREHGFRSATFHQWRSKFGGMSASLLAKINELNDQS